MTNIDGGKDGGMQRLTSPEQTEPFSRLKTYQPKQLFFMTRLSYLQRQRREVINVLDNKDWRVRLLNKALYSTYGDCVAEGVGSEAKLILGQPRDGARN